MVLEQKLSVAPRPPVGWGGAVGENCCTCEEGGLRGGPHAFPGSGISPRRRRRSTPAGEVKRLEMERDIQKKATRSSPASRGDFAWIEERNVEFPHRAVMCRCWGCRGRVLRLADAAREWAEHAARD